MDQHFMGTAIHPASTTPAFWEAFTDVDAFVDEVLAEGTAMAADGTRPARPGPKPSLTGPALRKAILAIWCVAFCGLPWRAIAQLSGRPFGTLDPARPRAPIARPPAPDLAAGLW
jgi:hypothetical protein